MSLARLFRGAPLDVEDLFLLEGFQIGYLPGWVPERELAVVLHAYPAIARILVKKHPPIAGYLERVLSEHGPARDAADLAACSERLVWTIPDLLTYNRCPEVYDAADFHRWDFHEVTDIVPLEGKVVIDAGAGTGRVALEAALTARWVFAVEPVARLREYVRERAVDLALLNVYAIDGFNHAIPLPDGFADVLITSHALGWRLEAELREFERVVRPGGSIVHCPGTSEAPSEEAAHATLVSSGWGYTCTRYREADGWKRKYWKQVP